MFKKTLYIALLSIVTSILTTSTYAFQHEDMGQKNSSLVLSKDYYEIGDVVNTKDEMNSDVNLIGNSININSQIAGSVQAIGRNITINAPISNNVRLVGNTIIINNSIDGDVVALGKNIIINSGSVINGDLLIYGTDPQVIGIVKGETKNLNEAIEQEQKNFEQQHKEESKTIFFGLLGSFAILKFLFLIGGAGLLIALGRNYIEQNIDILEKDPKKSFLTGLVAFLALPIASLLAFISIIGRPVGIVFSLLFFILILLYELLSTAHLTVLLMKRIKNPTTLKYIGVLLGTALIFVFINGIDILLAFFFLGSHITHIVNLIKRKYSISTE